MRSRWSSICDLLPLDARGAQSPAPANNAAHSSTGVAALAMMAPASHMSAPPVPFEILDHTADIGLVAYGRDLPELFANAARGMFHLLIDPRAVREQERRARVVEADDLEGLLVAWLNDLLVVLNADGYLPGDFVVEEVSPTRLRALLPGEPVDPQRHHFRLDVKAATYHTLRVIRGDGWSARVIFDI